MYPRLVPRVLNPYGRSSIKFPVRQPTMSSPPLTRWSDCPSNEDERSWRQRTLPAPSWAHSDCDERYLPHHSPAPQCPRRPTAHRPYRSTLHPHHFAVRARKPKVITTRLHPQPRRTFNKTSPKKFVTTPGYLMQRGSLTCSPPTAKVQPIPS